MSKRGRARRTPAQRIDARLERVAMVLGVMLGAERERGLFWLRLGAEPPTIEE